MAAKNKQKEYKCRMCGSTRVKAEPKGEKVGLYCLDCDAWVKWVDRKEGNRINRELAKEGNGYIKVVKRRAITVVNCGKCNTYLYTVGLPIPLGQFNVSEARFCPKCGSKLRS